MLSLTFWLLPQFSSVAVMSDSLRPHGLQYSRLPCPSSTPRACSNHVRWVSDAILIIKEASPYYVTSSCFITIIVIIILEEINALYEMFCNTRKSKFYLCIYFSTCLSHRTYKYSYFMNQWCIYKCIVAEEMISLPKISFITVLHMFYPWE